MKCTLIGGGTGRKFGEDGARLRDLAKERAVLRGIATVEAGGHHRHGGHHARIPSARAQRSDMGAGVDATRQSADDGDAGGGQRVTGFLRETAPGGRGMPRAYQGHGATARGRQPSEREEIRGCVGNGAKRRREILVLRQQRARAERLKLSERPSSPIPTLDQRARARAQDRVGSAPGLPQAESAVPPPAWRSSLTRGESLRSCWEPRSCWETRSCSGAAILRGDAILLGAGRVGHELARAAGQLRRGLVQDFEAGGPLLRRKGGQCLADG